MKRLCDDLQIPMDQAYDNRYYGSRLPVSYQRDQSQSSDYYRGSIRAEIEQPANNRVLDEYCSAGPRESESNMTKNRSSTSSNSLRSPVQLEPERFQEPEGGGEDADDVHQQDQGGSLSKMKAENGKGAEVDGYYSDFTNDTDNDIEEEFDFD